MRVASTRESRDSDRFLVNTQVQSQALLRRGFGTSVPFIIYALLAETSCYQVIKGILCICKQCVPTLDGP